MYVYWGKLNGVIKQSRDKAPTVPLSSPNKGYSSRNGINLQNFFVIEDPWEPTNNSSYCQVYIQLPQTDSEAQLLKKKKNLENLLSRPIQTGAFTENSSLLCSIHNTGRYSVCHKRRRVNSIPAINTLIYNGVMLER